jgi:hypothetical protein
MNSPETPSFLSGVVSVGWVGAAVLCRPRAGFENRLLLPRWIVITAQRGQGRR